MRRPNSEYGLALAELTTLCAIALAGGAGHREALTWSANRATNPRLEDYALLATSIDDGMPLGAACQLAIADSTEPRFQEFVTKLELSARLGVAGPVLSSVKVRLVLLETFGLAAKARDAARAGNTDGGLAASGFSLILGDALTYAEQLGASHLVDVATVDHGPRQPVELDAAGRLLISPSLRQYAGLEKEIWLVGQGRHFEIWSAAGWQALACCANYGGFPLMRTLSW